ncbi:MAG: class I SAM-dependent methyltransferase [Gammaproteobacteria bacterium]|nr:class I SAM-dependent methyltransferase [Gammaproteobacteria bacterium]
MTSWYHGGPRPPVEEFRALEIGCGDGTNLLGLAFYRPDAELFGVDKSPLHIAQAREGAQTLELKNIQFSFGDAQARAAAFSEPFHYIIVHGVFSWIDDTARAAILEFCHELLGEDGIAYISYNTLPGWSVRGVVRDLIRRSGVLPTEGDPVSPSRDLVERLKPLLPSRDNKYAALLEEEFDRLFNHEDSYLAHEYFSEHNYAFWFRDFVEIAEKFGLDYVAEMQFNRPEGRVPADLYEALAETGITGLHAEEMVDAICYRQFRMSLLCRSDAKRAQPFSTQDFGEITVASDSGDLAVNWPHGTRVDSAENSLLASFQSGDVNIRLREPVWGGTYSGYPKAHALARFEAARGNILTTPLHTMWPLDEGGRALVQRLDGSRSVAELSIEFGVPIHEFVDQLCKWGLLESGPD